MPILTVRHLTRYRYSRPVRFGEHRMMFRPREGYDQRILSDQLIITPQPSSLRFVHDVFGNCVGIAHFDRPADSLTFDSLVRLDHQPAPLDDDDGYADAASMLHPVSYSVEDLPDLLRSMERQHEDLNGAVEQWARSFLQADGRTRVLELLSAMTKAIHADFAYAQRLEVGTQTPAETLAIRAGSCRDLAVLMIDAVRSLGFAARFVSGYIYSGRDGPKRTGGGHTHAWARVYLPRCGWVEFDPTNGIVGSTDLIRVAVARDPRQALPLGGTWIGEPSVYLGMDVEVDVRVQRVPDTVRRAA